MSITSPCPLQLRYLILEIELSAGAQIPEEFLGRARSALLYPLKTGHYVAMGVEPAGELLKVGVVSRVHTADDIVEVLQGYLKEEAHKTVAVGGMQDIPEEFTVLLYHAENHHAALTPVPLLLEKAHRGEVLEHNPAEQIEAVGKVVIEGASVYTTGGADIHHSDIRQALVTHHFFEITCDSSFCVYGSHKNLAFAHSGITVGFYCRRIMIHCHQE